MKVYSSNHMVKTMRQNKRTNTHFSSNCFSRNCNRMRLKRSLSNRLSRSRLSYTLSRSWTCFSSSSISFSRSSLFCSENKFCCNIRRGSVGFLAFAQSTYQWDHRCRQIFLGYTNAAVIGRPFIDMTIHRVTSSNWSCNHGIIVIIITFIPTLQACQGFHQLVLNCIENEYA